jgi:hypothetical protein
MMAHEKTKSLSGVLKDRALVLRRAMVAAMFCRPSIASGWNPSLAQSASQRPFYPSLLLLYQEGPDRLGRWT